MLKKTQAHNYILELFAKHKRENLKHHYDDITI